MKRVNAYYILFSLIVIATSFTAEFSLTIALEDRRVSCEKVKILRGFSKRRINEEKAHNIITKFTETHSLSLVIGTCNDFPEWVMRLYCSENLRVYIYLKCDTPEHNLSPELPQRSPRGYSCIYQILLRTSIYYGQAGTIKYHLYNNYHNLTEYILFIKDNSRKTAGLSFMQRIGSAVLNIEHHSNRIRFMTLSDVPPSYHSTMRVHNQKSRSVRRSLPPSDEKLLLSSGSNSSLQISKYCRIFEQFTCSSCKGVWIPVRSQFIVSANAVWGINQDEFNIATSEHSEYTWAILFNCFSEKRTFKKGGYPFFACSI